jgi:hypothetical protein
MPGYPSLINVGVMNALVDKDVVHDSRSTAKTREASHNLFRSATKTTALLHALPP